MTAKHTLKTHRLLPDGGCRHRWAVLRNGSCLAHDGRGGEYWKAGGNPHSGDAVLYTTRREARAAIAKARGET